MYERRDERVGASAATLLANLLTIASVVSDNVTITQHIMYGMYICAGRISHTNILCIQTIKY